MGGCPYFCISIESVSGSTQTRISIARTIADWWSISLSRCGFWPTLKAFTLECWDFLRDSTPARKRQRYGDVEYDWDYRVDTTSATVSFRDRLLGVFHSAYQPTEPAAFHEMVGGLGIDFSQFVFVDLGSGKGRTLLMASDYPFHRIVGVELLPSLHRIAQENIRKYSSEKQRCFQIKSILGPGEAFAFPPNPTVLFLFNPFPESVLEKVMQNLERSLRESPRPVYVIYHNPLLERVVADSALLSKTKSAQQYCVYSTRQ